MILGNNFCKLIILTGCNEGVLITEKSLTPKSKEHLESSNIKNDCRELKVELHQLECTQDNEINSFVNNFTKNMQ